jgi:hypothetical protein
MKIIMTIMSCQCSPREYAPGDKQAQILRSGSHEHVCTLEKMTPRRCGHLEPENTTEICHDILKCSHIKH